MENSQKIKNKTPCDPAIPFLATYLKNMKTLIQKDMCTPMFTAKLFIKARMELEGITLSEISQRNTDTI